MRKPFKLLVTAVLSAVMLSVFALSMAACGSDKDGDACPYNNGVHDWGEWQRSATEHLHTCRDCGKKSSGKHTQGTCAECAYGFKVLAFGFDTGGDTAHSDFAREANVWFPARGEQLGFSYEYVGTDYSHLNDDELSSVDLVIFLNDRPWTESQQDAFTRYMEAGGAWMGFHSAAFSMRELGGYWDWYQDDFLACGDYAKNTWNPTSEPLYVETYDHPATKHLDDEFFISAPCEWYGWEYDLFENEDITVLLTLNPTKENPAGDQPDKNKQHEIWYDGHYPIAWANDNYNMVYMNWGHNLQSYNDGKEGKSSSTFSSDAQNTFMLDAMYGLALRSVKQRLSPCSGAFLTK
ncbi:MAG: ThuA domain-containing protein [Clostridiales bacterium]|nr:ThuA domain-containing protein [Clostridiales bacterium]